MMLPLLLSVLSVALKRSQHKPPFSRQEDYASAEIAAHTPGEQSLQHNTNISATFCPFVNLAEIPKSTDSNVVKSPQIPLIDAEPPQREVSLHSR